MKIVKQQDNKNEYINNDLMSFLVFPVNNAHAWLWNFADPGPILLTKPPILLAISGQLG